MVDVTSHTIAGTEFQEVYPLDILHEVFIMNQPSCTYRPEWRAAELGVQAIYISIVLTERTEHIVFLIISIGEVEITRSILVVSLRNNSYSFLDIRLEYKLACRVTT